MDKFYDDIKNGSDNEEVSWIELNIQDINYSIQRIRSSIISLRKYDIREINGEDIKFLDNLSDELNQEDANLSELVIELMVLKVENIGNSRK